MNKEQRTLYFSFISAKHPFIQNLYTSQDAHCARCGRTAIIMKRDERPGKAEARIDGPPFPDGRLIKLTTV